MKCVRKVRNPYTKRYLYVDCGKCPACRQKKAMFRAARIRANIMSDYSVLFFKLSYANEHVPYIRLSDLSLVRDGDEYTPVYRDLDIVRKVSHGELVFSVKRNIVLTDYHYKNLSSSQLFHLSKSTLQSNFTEDYRDYELHDKVGVLYYPDVQNFLKKLRKYIKNNEYFNETLLGRPIKYFVCGEYGETLCRPHFHFLLYVPKDTMATWSEDTLIEWKRAVCSCWTFGYDEVTIQRFEFAIDAARYVSEYVNSSADVPSFLQACDFKPCWHYSQGFGFGYSAFRLSSIVDGIDKESITFSRTVNKKDGTTRIVTNPLPNYVTNRWFFKFKGSCNLSSNDLYRIAEQPSSIYRFMQICNLTIEDCEKIEKKFLGIKYRWYKEVSSFYPYYYVKFFQLKNTYRNEQFYSESYNDREYIERYDNLLDVRIEKPYLLIAGRLSHYIKKVDSPWKLPSEYMRNITEDQQFTQMYNDFIKIKKLNSIHYAKNS